MVNDVLQRLGLPALGEPLPRPVIDSHTHIDATHEVSGLRQIDNLVLADAVGVSHMVQVGCDIPSSQWAIRLAATHPQVVAAIAIHPNDAARMDDAQLAEALTAIRSMARAGRHVRAIGECGLDYYRTSEERGIERQKAAFSEHVRIANEVGLSLVIHSRRAESKKAKAAFGDALVQAADILDEMTWPTSTIFHCFTGDPQFAERVLASGGYLSFAGNLTYPANKHIYESMMAAPIEKILVETDAPYLTPVPNRGKYNAPYLLGDTLRFIAQARGVDLAELCDQLVENTFNAFGGSWGMNADG